MIAIIIKCHHDPYSGKQSRIVYYDKEWKRFPWDYSKNPEDNALDAFFQFVKFMKIKSIEKFNDQGIWALTNGYKYAQSPLPLGSCAYVFTIE